MDQMIYQFGPSWLIDNALWGIRSGLIMPMTSNNKTNGIQILDNKQSAIVKKHDQYMI